MKKYLLSIVCILGTLVMMQSCVKEVQQSEKIKEITIDTTITAGSDYILNLAQYGDDNSVAAILEPGSNFSVSQLENIDDLFTTRYHYSAALKNKGTDKITLSISEDPKSSNGANKDSTIIYINFTIK